MIPMGEPHLKLIERSEFRLVCFGVSAMLGVYFGFIWPEVDVASQLVKRTGYYFMLGTFSLWVFTLWRLWKNREIGERISRREWVLATTTIGLLSLVALRSEPFRCKVLYDEFVLQSTAYNMHYFREASTMVRGYDVLGTFISTDTYLDKRPNFFPFLISLIHDVTGYRTANAFWLNAALLPVALSLAYFLGRRLNGMLGGLLAVLLLGSLPLLGQNATGSGMELLNVVMILTMMALGGAYLRNPDPIRLSAFAIGAVLLAQTRYESAIYVASAALVIAMGWWRDRKIILSWGAVVAPLLLLPSALQNKVLSNSRWMWELKDNQATRFSFDYFGGNIRAAWKFFFNTKAELANSWPLTVLGLLSFVYLLIQLTRLRSIDIRRFSDRIALFLFGLGIAINTVLIMFYYWSTLTDPLASRLSLPCYVGLALLTVTAAASIDRGRVSVTAALVAAIGIFAVSINPGHAAYHLYSHLGIDEIEWEKRYIAARPQGERLVVSNTSTIPWLLEKIPSILISRATGVADRLKYQLEQGTFAEILVFQSFRPTTQNGDHEMVPEDRLPAGYELELLAEKRFGTKIVHVSRLVSVKLPLPTHASSSTQ